MIRPWWGGGPRRGIRSRFEETFVRGEPLPGARPTSPGWHRSFPRRGTGPGPSLIARGRVGDACPARWASADLVRRDMAPRAMVARGPAKGREFRPGRVWGSICVLDDWAGSSPPPAGGRATGKPQSSLPGATHNSSRGPRRYGGLGLGLLRPAAHRFEPGRKGDLGTGSHGSSWRPVHRLRNPSIGKARASELKTVGRSPGITKSQSARSPVLGVRVSVVIACGEFLCREWCPDSRISEFFPVFKKSRVRFRAGPLKNLLGRFVHAARLWPG